MKKENNNQKTEFSVSKINRIISKINKTGLILIIACYVLLLSFALSLVGKDISYISEPNYEHQFYNKEISPQITLVGVREYTDGVLTTNKYSVSVNIAGRYIDSKDPNYKITSFRMFATTKAKLTDQNPNNTYYFTEHTSYSTPITHSFTVNSTDSGVNPSTFYVRLQYEKDGVSKVTTFKEDVFLQPTDNDKDGMDDWYNLNIETKPSAANILAFNDLTTPVGRFEAQCYKEKDDDGKETGIYLGGVRITIDSQISENYHIDMQSWVVTKSGEYLPFIGVYNYTGPSKTFTNSLKEIDSNVKPEYIVAKIIYRDESNETEYVNYFKQEINEINDSFSTSQEIGKDVDAGNVTKNYRTLYVCLIVLASVVLSGCIIGGSYIFIKQADKKKNKK